MNTEFGELIMILSVINKIKGIKAQESLIIMLLMLILTDISIIFNIPGFREILPIVYFTIIPGLLLIILFNMNKLEFLKKFVLWIGLSLGILIFSGMGLNSLYPLISQPLSLLPLIIALNIITILLLFIAYSRNKTDFEIVRIFNFELDKDNKLISPMIFSIIFPFLAFFGTFLMNNYGNNSILLLMLLLIPVYFVVLICLNNKTSRHTYPFAIWMVSLTFFLMHGLTSNYLIGRDIHTEFFSFQFTLVNLHWDPYIFQNNVNGCLTVTILPTIYSVLTSIQGLYIFKIVFGFIGSIIPLIIYLISKNFLEKKYALLATLLLIFQMNFIELLGIVRQEFAFLFFFLAVLILFDKEIGKNTKKFMFGFFMILVVLAHYTTAFFGLVMTIPVLLIPFLRALFIEKKIKLINFDVLAILGVLSFLWYSIVAKSQMNSAIGVVAKSGGSLTGVAVESATRESTILAIFGIGLKSAPQTISALVNDAIFLTIGIGLIAVLIGYNHYKEKISLEFIVASVVSTILLALFVIVPNFSNDYGPSRLFAQCLVFLAPFFVMGGIKIAKTIRMPKLDVFILIVLLISLFTVSIHFNYSLYGNQSSIYFDSNSDVRMETFIHGQDIEGAKFLSKYGVNLTTYGNESEIYGDAAAGSRLMAGNNFSIKNTPMNNSAFIDYIKSFDLNNTIYKHPYLYLSYTNTRENIIFESVAPTYIKNETSTYKFLDMWRSVIYDNGGSRVLIP